MSEPGRNSITIVGAGLAGSLLAIYLARRGYHVDVYEQYPDMRREDVPAGRSINLALAERGIHALKRAGVHDSVSEFVIPMRGRMVHPLEGEVELQRYGTGPDEVIYAAHRARLNEVLLDEADRLENVNLHFSHKLVGGDLARGRLDFRDESTGETIEVEAAPVIGADGAGSPLRGLIDEAEATRTKSDLLDHGYKELTIPPDDDGDYRLDPNALHIWPRGGYMLIALPNTDRSFTATLFLPNEGDPGFSALSNAQAVREFFRGQFPDAVPHIPRLVQEFDERPTGVLGTVRCPKWHHRGFAVVIGDAAHAIVPFHGQGMNCAFEDCEALDDILADGTFANWESVFSEFQERRQANAAAIADMALENYVEMRDSVRDPQYKTKRELELILARRHPDRFVPRYAMVMFRRMPYSVAMRRGAIQSLILDRLVMDAEDALEADLTMADQLIEQRLEPLDQDR